MTGHFVLEFSCIREWASCHNKTSHLYCRFCVNLRLNHKCRNCRTDCPSHFFLLQNFCIKFRVSGPNVLLFGGSDFLNFVNLHKHCTYYFLQLHDYTWLLVCCAIYNLKVCHYRYLNIFAFHKSPSFKTLE